jgi:phosphatidylserine/phosphatidylglycerophosphate/cardiolipin synthase-like enzyme
MELLQEYAKQVWMLSSIEDKKLVAHEMIDAMLFKKQQGKFRILLDRMNCTTKIDELVANITLVGSDLKVVR